MAVRPSTTASKFALSIGGQHAGYLKAFAGGNPYAQVITEQAGADGIQKKHIGNVSFEDIVAEFALSESAAALEWINAVLTQKSVIQNGAVLTLGQSGAVIEELQFSDAWISEIAFPASDGNSKEAAFLSVKIKPETVRITAGGRAKPPAPGKGQKLVLASNFRFQLGKLPTNRVSKIDAFVVKQNVVQSATGDTRGQELEAAGVEIPNLRVSLAAADAPAWRKWFDDFVINGISGDDRELDGSLTWLSADLKTALATLTLKHVGIFRFAPEAAVAGGAQLQRYVADLYCEQMSLSFKI